MEIILNRITLENFKGVRALTLTPQGEDLVVRGDNGTGKTTIVDAFLWLLFGKDSQGKSDFAIKTLDQQGQEIHGLDHSVGAEMQVDGRPVTLRKVYREKYTKKRGSNAKELTGHTTEHYVDGVPVKKKEWDQRIAELVDESTFKLLTSPSYFNSLHWEGRRRILLHVCGDVRDKDVIASNQDLAQLPKILGERSLEDHKKVVASRKKEINRRLTEIPARIDELHKSLPNQEGDPEELQGRITTLEQKIQDAQAGDGKAELRQKRNEISAELQKLDLKAAQERTEKQDKIKRQVRETKSEIDHSRREIESGKSEVRDLDARITSEIGQMDSLRDEYHRLAGSEYDGEGTCPACGQELPEDQIQQARERHNERRAKRLAEIQAEGKRLKAQAADREQRKSELNEHIRELTKKTEELEGRLQGLQEQLEQQAQQSSSYAAEIERLQGEIEALDQQTESTLAPDVSGLRDELEYARQSLAAIQAAKQTRARIEELKTEEWDLSREFEDLEHQTHLLEQFVISKVEMLEGKINSKFEMARFKLFEQQINGGVNEACETLYQGVPYGSGLNNGARINVGLDIIRTLSEHYGIKAPVFVDNAESVTDLIDPGTQTIKLVVDGSYPELTPAIQNAHKEAAQ